MGETETKDKVLYVFNASTHYYNLVLNKLDRETKYEIHLLVPGEAGSTVGAGVFQTVDNLKINYHNLEEKQYKKLGVGFKGLAQLIWKIRPKVIVMLECYQLSFFFNPVIFFMLKVLGIKVVLKSIPFRLAKYDNPWPALWNSEFRQSRGLKGSKAILRFVQNQLFLKFLYSRLYHAHVCYTDEAYNIYGSYGVRPEKIYLTYNSPDTDALLDFNDKAKQMAPILPANPHRLIHVGRLVDWKRVDLIIDVLAALKSKYPNIELLVIGNGPKREEWETYAAKQGVADRVEFLGGVYDLQELGRYFRSSSIYVLGGMGGLSINDAMCFERPILCSVCDGTEAKLVREGYNGFYFQEGSAQDLADKVDKMFQNPELLETMGRNSRQIIEDEVNVKMVIKGYTDIFGYVLGEKCQNI